MAGDLDVDRLLDAPLRSYEEGYRKGLEKALGRAVRLTTSRPNDAAVLATLIADLAHVRSTGYLPGEESLEVQP